MAINTMFLKGRTHDLGRMSLADLVKVYFTYPAVIVYVVLATISSAAAAILASTVWPLALAAVLAGLAYPLVWYTLHRFVLHGRFLYKNSLTAPIWKRVHFDHHQDPHNLRVLFGALYTTLPTVALVTLPIGWLIGGPASALAAFAGGVVTTCFYEFCHCVQHLNHMPRWPLLRRMKRLHLAHHFHNETGNFGITNFLWDRLFRTLYERPRGDLQPVSVPMGPRALAGIVRKVVRRLEAEPLGHEHGPPMVRTPGGDSPVWVRDRGQGAARLRPRPSCASPTRSRSPRAATCRA